MKLYTTTIKAISPDTGVLTTYAGPHVPGISFKDAQDYCNRNELGYCKVDGELVAEIPCNDDLSADFNNQKNYQFQLN